MRGNQYRNLAIEYLMINKIELGNCKLKLKLRRIHKVRIHFDALVAIYPIFIAVGLRQDCNKILLHFHYIWVSVGLQKKDYYIFITFLLHLYYIIAIEM